MTARARGTASGHAPVAAVIPAALTMVTVVLAGCSGSGSDAPRAAAPAARAPTSTTTTVVPAPDLSRVVLPPVPGRTRTTVEVRPGQATLFGIVMGPEGPLGGAVVQAERLVGDAAASVEVVSGLDGRWSIPAIKGGRYRVRAWRSPEFALTRPELVFLASSDAREIPLALERHGGPMAVGTTAPNPPVVNEPANLAVRLVERTVDDRGVVRAMPSPGVQLELSGPGHWQVRSPNPAVTDPAGVARWEVTCIAPGVQPLSVVPVGAVLAVAVPLPACRQP